MHKEQINRSTNKQTDRQI